MTDHTNTLKITREIDGLKVTGIGIHNDEAGTWTVTVTASNGFAETRHSGGLWDNMKDMVGRAVLEHAHAA